MNWLVKKKSIKIDDNNINNENKNFSQDKNERKNTNNNTIINILNKPFFCCLKSQLVIINIVENVFFI